jgi:hypothetical protein
MCFQGCELRARGPFFARWWRVFGGIFVILLAAEGALCAGDAGDNSGGVIAQSVR